jgi:hypothetical protein
MPSLESGVDALRATMQRGIRPAVIRLLMDEPFANAPAQTVAAAPDRVVVEFREVAYGRMRSRTVGESRAGTPEIVLVMGMAVSDYLLPGLAAFGAWTRAHLVDLPG